MSDQDKPLIVSIDSLMTGMGLEVNIRRNLLSSITNCVLIFERDAETTSDTVKRIVDEYLSICTTRTCCWYCHNQISTELETCVSCGRVLNPTIHNNISIDRITYFKQNKDSYEFSRIVALVLQFILIGGKDSKNVWVDEIYHVVRWIKTVWLASYRAERQCWNCHAYLANDYFANDDECPFCKKHLGFLPKSLSELETHLTNVLARYRFGGPGLSLAQEFAKGFGLESPCRDDWKVDLYSTQAAEILRRKLNSDEIIMLDNLYNYEWWGLYRV